MSDNVEATSGSGGPTFATDEISSVHYPRTKLIFGADGVNSGDVAADNPLPIYVVSALPAGTHNIGDIDVVSVVPGTGATSLGKAVDSAGGSTDTGVAPLAIRDDALSSLTPAEGDYANLRVDANGALWATISGTVTVASHAVTNAGTFAVQVDGSALTALQLLDDVVYIDDADWTATTSKHSLIGGVYQSTPGTITDGDTGPLRVNANGALHVAIVSGAGSGGTASADDADFAAGTTSGTPAMGVYEASPTSVADGDLGIVGITQTRAMRVSVDNTVTVASHAVTNAGTFVVQENGAALTALQVIDDWDESDRAKVNLIVGQAGIAAGAGAVGVTVPRVTLASNDPAVAFLTTIDDDTSAMTTSLNVMDDWDNAASDGASVSGDVAHDAVDAGEPVKMGFKAVTSISGLTLVAANDRTNGFAGVDGVQVQRPHTLLEDIVVGNASNTDGASTEVIATAGAGIKQYLTSCTLINSSAAFAYCEIKSGSTVRWRFPVPATGGVTHSWNPPLSPNAANEAWSFDMSAATTTAFCSLCGFKSKI